MKHAKNSCGLERSWIANHVAGRVRWNNPAASSWVWIFYMSPDVWLPRQGRGVVLLAVKRNDYHAQSHCPALWQFSAYLVGDL